MPLPTPAQHLESKILVMLERPEMYASTPDCLEEKLMLLDELRQELCPPDHEPQSDGYPAFLRSRGHGVALFCFRQREAQHEPKSDAALFARLVQLWREYLQSDYFERM